MKPGTTIHVVASSYRGWANHQHLEGIRLHLTPTPHDQGIELEMSYEEFGKMIAGIGGQAIITPLSHTIGELDAFSAGWDAYVRYSHHDWGPAPPDNPEAAYALWKLTCDNHHVIRIRGCESCDALRARGVKGIEDRKYDKE